MAKPKLQVDMYAVGLGAGLLVQSRMEDGLIVRVLADAGMGHGYKADGVHTRLPDAMNAFDQTPDRRIDLIIGTHYDADHLKGLVPICEDDTIDIGAVWLPPIKDDTAEIASRGMGSDLLAHIFFDSEGEAALVNYLARKHAQIEEIAREEERAVETARGGGDNVLMGLPYYLDIRRERPRLADQPTIEQYERYFEAMEGDAVSLTGGKAPHDADVFDSRIADAVDRARRASAQNWYSLRRAGFDVEDLQQDAPGRERIAPALLANIRKAASRSAITASNLHKVVQALKNRKQPVRPECHIIAAGEPARFAWTPGKKRFVKREKGGTTDMILTLLGPDEALVQKHQERIPVGAYLVALTRYFDPIPLEGITASNQLSYILTLESHEQRLLVSGDAGCYGFKDADKTYFPKLLQELKRLHVVQIAHHAGHNYDFYNALLASGFAEQTEFAHLLLSHEVDDKTRPSAPFAEFIARIRQEEDDVQLLFTSRPTADKVQDFDELIGPVVPAGAEEEKGDVRLVYGGSGESPDWELTKHAVSVA